ncbi:MAG TPA: hypothetical protein PKE46_10555 [Micropruina sp.]|nr:hypothetical protein [Micropruina sp.]
MRALLIPADAAPRLVDVAYDGTDYRAVAEAIGATWVEHVRTVIQLGHALAGAESFLGIKDGWRSDLGRDKKHRTLASYLKLLEHLGYVLSPVEQLAAGYRLRKGESL